MTDTESTHLGIAEVKVDGLGMPNVQDAIGFWWESCVNFAAYVLEMLLQQCHCLGRDHVAICLVVLTCQSKLFFLHLITAIAKPWGEDGLGSLNGMWHLSVTLISST